MCRLCTYINILDTNIFTYIFLFSAYIKGQNPKYRLNIARCMTLHLLVCNTRERGPIVFTLFTTVTFKCVTVVIVTIIN